jgi:hypothetical protein
MYLQSKSILLTGQQNQTQHNHKLQVKGEIKKWMSFAEKW